MITLLVISLFVLAFILLALGNSNRKLERKYLYLFAGFLALIAATGLGLVYSSLPSYNASAASVASNTLYYNANYSMLTFYAYGSGISAWLGSNQSSLFMTANGVAATALEVPQGFYFKFNYTAANVVEVKRV